MHREAPIAESCKFSKYIPDWEDMTACNLAYINAEHRLAEGLDAGAIFNIGFYRGIAWAKYRNEIEKEKQS